MNTEKECENEIKVCQTYAYNGENDLENCEGDLFCKRFPTNHRCEGYV
jgi:hypothetical protein